MMCKGGDRRRPDLRIVPEDKHTEKVRRELESGTRRLKPIPTEWMDFRKKPLDCSAGDRPQVILSDTTAILMAEAFVDMANARRLYVDNLEASEAMTRAFGEIELLQKAIEARDGVVA